MEYSELFRLILRRWWLIAFPVVLSAVIAIPELLAGADARSGGFTTEIRYSAAQRINLPAQDGDFTDVWVASEHTIDALTDWSRASSFRQEIADQLAGSDIPLDSLGIAADNVRNVGVLYLSHHNHESLQAISTAAMLVLSDRNETYFPQLGGDAAEVTILQEPAIHAVPVPLSARLAPMIRIGVAMLIGLALAFLAEYIDQTIYHPNDLRQLGMPLVGSIPRHRA